jgi:hypothetical protein
MMLTDPSVGVIGASGAIFGVALAFAMFWPDAQLFVFPLPMPVKAKWLVIFLAAMNLFSAVLGARDGVAHLAHLGGFLFGYIFLRVEGSVRQRAREVFTRPQMARVVPPRRGRERVRSEARAAKEKERDSAVYDEVDRVLDKISEHGMDSLTPEEQRLLTDVSRRLRHN